MTTFVSYINLSYLNVELVQVSDISQANQKRCVNTFRGVSSNRITLHTQKLYLVCVSHMDTGL